MFDYLEWSKEGEKGKGVKATTYHSKKMLFLVNQPSEFTTTLDKCCRCFFLQQQNFAFVIILIPIVKTIVTSTNVFTLFQALSCRHSRSLVV